MTLNELVNVKGRRSDVSGLSQVYGSYQVTRVSLWVSIGVGPCFRSDVLGLKSVGRLRVRSFFTEKTIFGDLKRRRPYIVITLISTNSVFNTIFIKFTGNFYSLYQEGLEKKLMFEV